METGKFTPKSRRSCLLRACLLPAVHFSAAITPQALPPDASSMFLTPSSRLLMFIKDSGYGILFSPSPPQTHILPFKNVIGKFHCIIGQIAWPSI